MTIQAGRLRTSIQIQSRDIGQDATGQPLTTWTTWATVWARIVSVTGSENFKGMQFSPEVTHQVTVRWLDGVKPMQRILVTDSNQILDILNANYGERRLDDTLNITCKERISQNGDENVG